MTNRDQEDETNKGGNEAVFSSDFSKVPAEVGKDAGVLKPFDIRGLEGQRTVTRAGGTMEATVTSADRGDQHIEIQGVGKENGQPVGSWENSYLQRPDGKLETSGCVISAGGSVEKWKRFFDKEGRVTSETDEVDGKKRQEALFTRNPDGRVVNVRNLQYSEDGIVRMERTTTTDPGGKHIKSVEVAFDGSGNETGRMDMSPWNQNSEMSLEKHGVFTSTLKLGAGGNKNFERV